MLWLQRICYKRVFCNYFFHSSDITFKMKLNEMVVHKKRVEDWNITLVDTETDTMTGVG